MIDFTDVSHDVAWELLRYHREKRDVVRRDSVVRNRCQGNNESVYASRCCSDGQNMTIEL